MEAKEKVSFIHSITAKIMLMVVVMVSLSLMACISIANVRASATVNNVNENFILSLTESAAKTLDKIPAEVDFSTQCAAVMQDMRMEGVSSAYGYLVDSDGTMLYHPTADKIGKSVENEVVKGVVSQLQSGNIPQDAVVIIDKITIYHFSNPPFFIIKPLLFYDLFAWLISDLLSIL